MHISIVYTNARAEGNDKSGKARVTRQSGERVEIREHTRRRGAEAQRQEIGLTEDRRIVDERFLNMQGGNQTQHANSKQRTMDVDGLSVSDHRLQECDTLHNGGHRWCLDNRLNIQTRVRVNI